MLVFNFQKYKIKFVLFNPIRFVNFYDTNRKLMQASLSSFRLHRSLSLLPAEGLDHEYSPLGILNKELGKTHRKAMKEWNKSTDLWKWRYTPQSDRLEQMAQDHWFQNTF